MTAMRRDGVLCAFPAQIFRDFLLSLGVISLPHYSDNLEKKEKVH